MPRGRAVRPTRRERPLDWRQPDRAEVIERGVESAGAVEVARAARLVLPRRGVVAQCLTGAQLVALIVGPLTQPGPMREQRLVRDLDGRFAGRRGRGRM